MFVRVTCAGVLVGTAELDPPQGLSHAVLHATAAYASVALFARQMGDRLSAAQYWPSTAGDFGNAVASRWDGGRLALEDDTGRELAVNGIVLIEGFPGDTVRVVVDFRSDLARVSASMRPVARPGDAGRARRSA